MLETTREELEMLLSSFHCSLDNDIEFFLKNRAVSYENLSKSRTYLILDEDELISGKISDLTILGYISLALKVLTVPEDTSNRMRKEIDGLSAKIHGEQITAFPVYLIGQLGKNTKLPKNVISGKQLLDYAFDAMQPAVNAVGGRYILIECHDKEELIRFYKSNGFIPFAKIPDQDNMMVQMLKKF
jgi:hypothetical protein